jgi:hypothetical protein
MNSRALLCLLLVPGTACVLEASTKSGCHNDDDCNAGRVCSEYQCVASDIAAARADAAGVTSEVDAGRAPREDGWEPPEDGWGEPPELQAADAGHGALDAELPARDSAAGRHDAASFAEAGAGSSANDASAGDAGDGASASCACEQPEAQVSWSFPASALGFYSATQTLAVRGEQAAISWLEEIHFLGEGAQLAGATLGLESAGLRPDGSTGKVAFFSMRGATGANGDGCQVSPGPEPVTTCRIAFDFLPDHSYVWRIWILNDDSSLWWWWGAWIMDGEGVMAEVPIGALRGPPGRNAISRTENYVRYSELAPSCDELPASHAHFSPPLLDGADFRAQTPALGAVPVPSCRAASLTAAAGGVDVLFGAP